MPAKTEGMPKMLAAHVHALLVQTGMTKTAKKFEGEFGGEIADIDGTPTLMELYAKHIAPADAPKKEKKGKKTREEAAEEVAEEEAPKRKKQAHDEDEEEPANKKKSKKSKKQEEAAGAEEEEEEKPKAKKPKQEEKPADEEASTEAEAPATGGKQGKKGKGGNVPFQRIKSDEVTYLKVKGGQAEAARLLDNTFESKFKDGWANGEVREDYGAKASATLVAVRGKDFRHEKTKKKRGTYKGGPIDMQSNSIKFVNSSDEDE